MIYDGALAEGRDGMLDGSDRVTFQDVYVLAQSDAVLLRGFTGKVMGIPRGRLLHGTEIPSVRGGEHSTLVLERTYALARGLLPR